MAIVLREFLADDSVKNQALKNVYRLIHQKGQISKNDLLIETKIKQTTLNRMLAELVKNDFIKESGLGKSSGGRRPVLFEIVPDASYVIGIDLSRAETKVILMDLNFHPLEIDSFVMTEEDEPERTFFKISQMIARYLENASISFGQLLGIGVGTVGPVDRERGIIHNPEAFQAPNWENVRIRELLKLSEPVPIVVDNGANAAAVVEELSHGFLYKNILACIGGYGIRCGVISNGEVIHAREGDSSAYGHIIIQAGGKPCVCGQQGCLLTYASFEAMLEDLSYKQEEQVKLYSMDRYIQRLKDRDPVIEEITKKSAYYYGIGIANMINVLHPELVVLYGPLIYESSLYYEAIVESAKKHLYISDKERVKFSKGMGRNGIAIGAGIQVFRSYL